MIVTTRKLDATDTMDTRIKVTAEDGATGTYPYPYRQGLDGREAHAWAVRRLFPLKDFGEPVWVEETARGERFRVKDGGGLATLDDHVATDVMARPEDRKAASRRREQRRATALDVPYDA